MEGGDEAFSIGVLSADGGLRNSFGDVKVMEDSE
jgi:hypothetical protein